MRPTLVALLAFACQKEADTASLEDPCTATDEVDADEDGYTESDGDCDDHDNDVHPGAFDGCDGEDTDCDGQVDEDEATVWYADEDEDGYGDPDSTEIACDQPVGYVADAGDCADSDPSRHEGADEIDNGVDDDCDGDVDEGNGPFSVSVTWDIDLFVEISGGAGTYDFGMAETGVGEYGWFGETCIPGDEPYGYPDYGVDVCHTLGSTGGTLVSVSPNVGDVDDGYTLFNEDIGNDGTITYALFQIGGDACWVWGDDPLYYAAFGCIVL